MKIWDFFKEIHNDTFLAKRERPIIGLVVSSFEKGGLEQVVVNLFNGYIQNGYEAFILVENDLIGIIADQVDKERIFVFHSNEKLFFGFIKEKGINVLHYHYNTFACDKLKKYNISSMYTIHNVYTWKNDEEIIKYNRCLDNVDCLVAVSKFVKDYYCARTNTDSSRINVIYNGIDFEELDYSELPTSLSRHELGIEECITIGFVASFYPVKYQICMIGVLEELVKKYPNVKLIFIGNHENEYYELFQEILTNSPAKDNIKVISYFDHKYIGEFLRQCVDIFTLPTLQEGCSNAVLEALYCDCPMVITKVGNWKELEHMPGCIVVPTAYNDILTTSNEEIIKMSREINANNKKDLVRAFSEMLDNLDDYVRKAQISSSEKNSYNKIYMIDEYVKLINDLF